MINSTESETSNVPIDELKDPENDIMGVLEPDLLHNLTIKIMNIEKYELHSLFSLKEDTDNSTTPITWKQKGKQFAYQKLSSKLKPQFLETFKITDDDFNQWFNFYKSESTDLYVKENGKQLESFVLKIVPNLEELYHQTKQNQLNLHCYPGCSNRMMGFLADEIEVELGILMISVVFIERELEKIGICCNFDNLKPKKLECVVA